MSLENEFAVDIHDDDIRKAQAFYAAVRMIHVRLCKVANLSIHMNTYTLVRKQNLSSSTRAFLIIFGKYPQKLCIVSAIRDARPSPKWLEMEWSHQAAGITPRLSAETSQGRV